MTFGTTEKAHRLKAVRPLLWLVTRAVGKLRCVLPSRRTHVYYISTFRECQRLFVSVCFGLPKQQKLFACYQGGGQTHTHTHRSSPERRATTAGRTAQTHQAERTDGNEETATQRQPNGTPRTEDQRANRPQPAGRNDGRAKRTKRQRSHRRRTRTTPRTRTTATKPRTRKTNNIGTTPK